jgi:N-acetylglucosamine-6-sulfatase
LAELYDLKNDPAETTNLISSANHANRIAALREELADLMAETGLTPSTDKMPIDQGIKAALPDQKIR